MGLTTVQRDCAACDLRETMSLMCHMCDNVFNSLSNLVTT